LLSRDHRALANIEACLGDYTSAEQNYRIATKLDRENGYVIGLAINLNNLSELLILNSRYSEAATMIEESLSYAEGADIHLVPYLNLNKAQLAFDTQDLETAQHFAELCYQESKMYAQINLQSRSKTLLAHITHLQGHEDRAKHHIQKAIYIAAENNATASLMQAFVVQSQLTNDHHMRSHYLHCIIQNTAAEYSDKQKAQNLLDVLNGSNLEDTKNQNLSIPELLANALPHDSFVYHKDTLIMDK